MTLFSLFLYVFDYSSLVYLSYKLPLFFILCEITLFLLLFYLITLVWFIYFICIMLYSSLSGIYFLVFVLLITWSVSKKNKRRETVA